jgi:hypothetical protein
LINMMENREGRGFEPLRIRAHHLLCMQGFQGLGYNEEFTKNMAWITDKILNEPFFLLEIITEADSICQHCPHLVQDKCDQEHPSGKIKSMDIQVLKNLKIKPGTLISSQEALSRTRNIPPAMVKKICGNCLWREDCLYYQEKSTP